MKDLLLELTDPSSLSIYVQGQFGNIYICVCLVLENMYQNVITPSCIDILKLYYS
jgi:hypothetical protein